MNVILGMVVSVLDTTTTVTPDLFRGPFFRWNDFTNPLIIIGADAPLAGFRLAIRLAGMTIVFMETVVD